MSIELLLSIMVLSFGTIALIMEGILLNRRRASPVHMLRVFAVTIILIGTLFVIAAGFGSEQIAPAMGLFGTLAGYLLGRTTPNTPAPPTTSGDSNDTLPS